MSVFSKIVSIVLCASMLPMTAFGSEEGVVRIYVSKDGNDANVESEASEARVRTPEGAKQRFLYLKQKNPEIKNFELVFSEGEYSFSDSLVLEKTDTEGCSVTIKAADGERVEFTGSLKIPASAFGEITDKAVRDRLSKPENVYCADLTAVGVSADMIGKIPNDLSRYQDNAVYVGGKRQSIAQWPNGRYSYTVFEKNTDTSDGFYYTEDRLSTSAAEPDAYIGGYLTYDYTYAKHKIMAVDTENKTITVAGKVNSAQSKRFKIFNALSELDTPGEYYIDREKMLLYYYPKEEPVDCEIAVCNKALIQLYGASGVTIEGICFERTRNGAIAATHEKGYGWGEDNLPQGSDGLQVRGCTFDNMSGNAIKLDGNVVSDFLERDYSTFNVNNMLETETYGSDRMGGGKNWIIENNLFYSLDDTAVSMLSGGNPYKLEKSNNLIQNNYFTQTSMEHPSDSALTIKGIGVKVKNNLFHNIGGQVILHNGFEHEISYNEFSNAIKEVQDAGVIYAGRTIIRRGAEISYNLIKDFLPIGQCMKPHSRAIYYDDELCGQKAHHNMIADGDKAITYSGSSGEIYANVSVDTINGLDLEPYGSTWTNPQKVKYEHWVNGQENTKYNDMPEATYLLWNKNYPAIMQEYEYWKKSKETENEVVEGLFVNVYDNLTVGRKNKIYTKYEELGGRVENNLQMTEFSDFADYKNYDLRIKSDAEILKTNQNLLTVDNFSMDSIGIQNEEIKAKALSQNSFSLTSPKNGECINCAEAVTLLWENSIGADKYKIEISKDREFKNIVDTIVTYNNSYEVRSLDRTHGEYFWRVTAINETREKKGEWSADEVYSFRLAENDIFVTKYSDYLIIEVPEGMKASTTLTVLTAEGEPVAGLEQINPDMAQIPLSSLDDGAVIYAETVKDGITYKRSVKAAEAAMSDTAESYDDFSGDNAWVKKTIDKETGTITESAPTMQNGKIKVEKNAVYTAPNHKSAKNGEFELTLTDNQSDGWIRGALQGVRASELSARDGDFYMKGYAVAYIWGNIQLLKLDGTMGMKTATDYNNNSSAKLASGWLDAEAGKEYRVRMTTETLSDGAVKLGVFISEVGEAFDTQLLSYVDRNNPYLSGENIFAAQGIADGDYELDNIKSTAYSATTRLELKDIVGDYGYKIQKADGKKYDFDILTGKKRYSTADMSGQKVHIELYDMKKTDIEAWAAVYQDGQLKSVTRFSDSDFSAELTVPEAKTDSSCRIKIFMWSDAFDMQPLYEASTAAE